MISKPPPTDCSYRGTVIHKGACTEDEKVACTKPDGTFIHLGHCAEAELHPKPVVSSKVCLAYQSLVDGQCLSKICSNKDTYLTVDGKCAPNAPKVTPPRCTWKDHPELNHDGPCTEAELHPKSAPPKCADNKHFLGSDNLCHSTCEQLGKYEGIDGLCHPKADLANKLTPTPKVTPTQGVPTLNGASTTAVVTAWNPATAIVPLGPHTPNCSDITDASHPSSGTCPTQAASFLQSARAAPATPGVTSSFAGYNYLMAVEALRAAGDFVQLVAVLTEAGLPASNADQIAALAQGRLEYPAPSHSPFQGPFVCAAGQYLGTDNKCYLNSVDPTQKVTNEHSPDPIPPYVSDQCIRVGVPKQLMATDHWTYTYSTMIYTTKVKGCPEDPSYSYPPNDNYSYDVGVVLFTDGPPDVDQIHAAPP